uniref:Transcription elongation factor B polypeptide 2 n=1 Tax=Parastrongyloides trichosuri TaxID=131310 RepID=A0A0N4ZV86_PARTI
MSANNDLYFEALHGNSHYLLILKESQTVHEMKDLLEPLAELSKDDMSLFKRSQPDGEWVKLNETSILSDNGFDIQKASPQAPAQILIKLKSEGDNINIEPVSIPPPLPEAMQNPREEES